MNKRHYEHTLPNIRGSLSNTYHSIGSYENIVYKILKTIFPLNQIPIKPIINLISILTNCNAKKGKI